MKIKEINVEAGGTFSGVLQQNTQFVFAYQHGHVTEPISIGMPTRVESYTSGALFPVFEMNLPEGYVRHYLMERLRKQHTVNDLLFLALSGDNGPGRLGYRLADYEQPEAPEGIALDEILHWSGKENLFSTLVETYLISTSTAISGIQPKVLVPDYRATFQTPSLIVKSGLDEYPGLAINEYLCLSIAKKAGMDTPDFWLSDDCERFVMRRFDLLPDGTRLGMEDFCVLMNRAADHKYTGSYENLFKIAKLYNLDTEKLYRQLVLTCLMGNGDGHLKNFAVLYENTVSDLTVSPVFDVVCTQIYDDPDLALKLGKVKTYPERSDLIRFAKAQGIRNSGDIIDQIAEAAVQILDENKKLAQVHGIGAAISKSISHGSTDNLHPKPPYQRKRRKT